jgi:hypothetical protein
MRKSNTFLQLTKGSLNAFRAIAKGYQTPFRANTMRNPRIAYNTDNVSSIPLGELNLKVPKREIFDRPDFPDFYTIKSLWVGDLLVKILTYYFNF